MPPAPRSDMIVSVQMYKAVSDCLAQRAVCSRDGFKLRPLGRAKLEPTRVALFADVLICRCVERIVEMGYLCSTMETPQGICPTCPFYRTPTKSVIYDGLALRLTSVAFEEISTDVEYVSDVDYIGCVGDKAFGIQIRPATTQTNFENYFVSERMKFSFQDFQADFGGKVFIVFSLDGEIANQEAIPAIEQEIARLRQG